MLSLLEHEGVAIETTTGRYSYSDIRQVVLERSDKWKQLVCVGQTVHILDQDVIQQVFSVFTCIHLGLIPTLSMPEDVPVDFECIEGELLYTNHRVHRFHPEVGIIFTTSGTTSSRRIVGHRLSAIMQCAQDMNQVLNMDSKTRTALILPLSFHYGFSMLTSTFRIGGTVLIPENYEDTFTLPSFLERMSPTMMGTVPHCWALLLRMLSPTIWQHLQTCILAGDECPSQLMRKLSRRNSNMNIHIFYGSTEVLRTCHRLWCSDDPQGLIGQVLPSVQLEQTESGIFQTGVTVCQEIVENGMTTHSSPSTWRLSDELHLDAMGLWHFVSRSSDVIKISGVRYSPRDIEEPILQHPNVLDVVVGLIDGRIIAVLYVDRESFHPPVTIELPSRLRPRDWIVLNESFDSTERQKRSRTRILQNVVQHHTRTTEPPDFLVIRQS